MDVQNATVNSLKNASPVLKQLNTVITKARANKMLYGILTIREAADKDYIITVLSDCCADADEEVHCVLITKIFPHQADVATVEEWCPVD